MIRLRTACAIDSEWLNGLFTPQRLEAGQPMSQRIETMEEAIAAILRQSSLW